ncbi:dCTP deaminase [Novosphingobium percolationis]|uniref:dCTP deaminase n=1 Tax=Novosphingobium percolationis TaxID=2871811 RepID=UPI001CD7D642|nr:dCTP deaminase [Novosphingobium percolationis]
MSAAFLIDGQYEARRKMGESIVTPFDESSLQPASIDLRLSDQETVYDLTEYVLGQDLGESQVTQRQFSRRKVKPGETVFITLKETIAIPSDCLGFVFPRSSITRLGIIIPPVYMNPGYRGRMPLTITNASPVEITILPDIRVAQLICATLNPAPSHGYAARPSAKYADEKGAASMIASDADIRAAVAKVLAASVPSSLRE